MSENTISTIGDLRREIEGLADDCPVSASLTGTSYIMDMTDANVRVDGGRLYRTEQGLNIEVDVHHHDSDGDEDGVPLWMCSR